MFFRYTSGIYSMYDPGIFNTEICNQLMTQNNLQLIIIRLYYFTRNNVELITNSCAFHILSAEEDFFSLVNIFNKKIYLKQVPTIQCIYSPTGFQRILDCTKYIFVI